MGGRGAYSGKSSSGNSVNTSKQTEHLDLMLPTQLMERYTDLGVSDPKGTIIALNNYTAGGYSDMREGKYPEQVKLIDEVIDKQPKWDGTIYRGMKVNDDFIENLKNSVGDSIQISPKSPTSFSSHPDIARGFANSGGKGNAVVFEMKNKRGSSIAHNSMVPGEQEVLHKSGEKYKIKKVTRLEDGTYHVVLEDSE